MDVRIVVVELSFTNLQVVGGQYAMQNSQAPVGTFFFGVGHL
jgi:hypothetical protein